MTQAPLPLDEIAAHTALRGAAAFCVVLYHVSLPCEPHLPWMLQGFIAHSYLFVDLFFGLSGYILGRKYANVFSPGIKGPDLWRFAVLRFARLYPNYLFWFLAALSLSLAFALREPDLPLWSIESTVAVLQHLTATQGLLSASPQWNVPLWSIGVEFMLYAMLPTLLFLLGRMKGRAELFCVCLGLAIVLTLASLGSIDVITGLASVLRGVASFAIGAVLARHAARPVGLSDRLLSGLQILALGLVLVMVALGQEVLAVLSFYGLIAVSQFNAGLLFRLGSLPLARLLGALSYSVYLSHAVMLQIALVLWYKIASSPSGLDFFAVGGLTLALSLGAAKLTHDYLERPAQRWLTHAMLRRAYSPRNSS